MEFQGGFLTPSKAAITQELAFLLPVACQSYSPEYRSKYCTDHCQWTWRCTNQSTTFAEGRMKIGEHVTKWDWTPVYFRKPFLRGEELLEGPNQKPTELTGWLPARPDGMSERQSKRREHKSPFAVQLRFAQGAQTASAASQPFLPKLSYLKV